MKIKYVGASTLSLLALVGAGCSGPTAVVPATQIPVKDNAQTPGVTAQVELPVAATKNLVAPAPTTPAPATNVPPAAPTTPPAQPQTAPTPVVAPPPAAVAPKAQTVSVDISNFSFQPQTLTIAPGTTVVWTNKDSAPHTVTASDKSFDSGTLATGATFSHAFAAAGQFSYGCSIHTSMQAKVVVQ